MRYTFNERKEAAKVDDSSVLLRCPLFSGLTDEELSFALTFFQAREARYEKGAFLNRIGSPLPAFGLVLEGSVQVNLDDMDGQTMILQTVSPGGTFGESLNFLQSETFIYITAFTDVRILWLRTDRVRDIRNAADRSEEALITRFITMLARRTLSMNDRIQVLSQKSIRKKLIAFFTQERLRYGDSFTLPFDRNSMAVYLGTDRTALSRELSAMKKEGIIDFHKNRFSVLSKFENS